MQILGVVERLSKVLVLKAVDCTLSAPHFIAMYNYASQRAIIIYAENFNLIFGS
jgi:hypothetical protein